jgi:hypothetical protein
VREYFLFDPLLEYLSPPLQGFGLIGGAYQSIAATSAGALHSDALGLDLRQEGDQLRFFDPRTGRLLPTPAEETAARQAAESRAQTEVAARQAAEARAETEAAARRALEAEVARLRAELAKRSE